MSKAPEHHDDAVQRWHALADAVSKAERSIVNQAINFATATGVRRDMFEVRLRNAVTAHRKARAAYAKWQDEQNEKMQGTYRNRGYTEQKGPPCNPL